MRTRTRPSALSPTARTATSAPTVLVRMTALAARPRPEALQRVAARHAITLAQRAVATQPFASHDGRASARFTVPRSRHYTVQEATGAVSIAFETEELSDRVLRLVPLSVSIGRYARVITLKVYLRQEDATVLHRRNDRWAPVSDQHVIDLNDETQCYIFGEITVLS